MNNDQLGSLIRSALKIAGGILVAHGLTAEATLINTPDVAGLLMAVIGLLASHFNHAADNAGTGAGGSKTSLLVALLLPVLFFTGCATTYRVEKSADISVTAALSAWNDYVAQNHPPVSEELAVRAAFQKVQSAELAAVDATIMASSLSTTNASPLPAIVTADYQSAANALADLVNLLRQFGVKI
jgi:hypothetical protein